MPRYSSPPKYINPLSDILLHDPAQQFLSVGIGQFLNSGIQIGMLLNHSVKFLVFMVQFQVCSTLLDETTVLIKGRRPWRFIALLYFFFF